MTIQNIIRKEMEKSGGSVRVVKVPKNRRPTAKSLRKLEFEISSHIRANEAMRNRSIFYAEKTFL